MKTHLTPEQLAERLHVKLSTIQSWRIKGGGPAYIKTGHRTILYDLDIVEKWENERRYDNVSHERASRGKK